MRSSSWGPGSGGSAALAGSAARVDCGDDVARGIDDRHAAGPPAKPLIPMIGGERDDVDRLLQRQGGRSARSFRDGIDVAQLEALHRTGVGRRRRMGNDGIESQQQAGKDGDSDPTDADRCPASHG